MNGVKFCYGSPFSLLFSVKVLMVPIHIWLPEAHVDVLIGGFVILVGFFFKTRTPHGP